MSMKQSLRRTLRAPAFAIAVVVLVAGVVAINATMFSALHTLRWRALPFADGDRIVHVGSHLAKLGFSIGLSERFREQLAGEPDLIAGALGYLPPDGAPKDDAGREWRIARPSLNWLDVLGVQPALGRGFAADDFSADVARNMLLSDRTWRTRFNADPAVLGRDVRVGEQVYTVIGVMPAGFAFPDSQPDAWTPLVLSAQERAQAPNASVGDLNVAARLAPGATVAQVRERLDALFAADARVADVRQNAGLRARVVSWRDHFQSGELRTVTLLQIAGLVLLAAVIANLVNLHLDRLLGRAREFQLQRALGAGDGAILRSVLGDLAPPLLAGFALGSAAVPFGLKLLVTRGLMPERLLQPAQFGLTSIIAGLCITALVAVCVALAVVGLRRIGGLSRRAGVGGMGRARAAMLVGQVMLTTVLLGGSGLLLRSAMNLMAVDPGFDPNGLVLTRVDFPASASTSAAGVESLRADIAAMPGVEQVAIADIAPFSGTESAIKFRATGNDAVQQARSRSVGAGYFDAMGIRMLRGRDFTTDDATAGNAVIVDQRYVDLHLAGGDPLTASVEIPDGTGTFQRAPIIAVVNTVKTGSLAEVVEMPTLYFPQDGAYDGVFLLTRTHVDPSVLIEPMRQRILDSVAGAQIGWHQPMLLRIADTLAPRRAMIEMIGLFAVATLLLAGFGLASVLGVVVRRREAEFGVRMAIGATAARIQALVLRQGGVLIIVGVALGLAAGLLLAQMFDSHLMQGHLFQLSPRDALTWSIAPAIVVFVALAACWLPARRAAAAAPASALHSE